MVIGTSARAGGLVHHADVISITSRWFCAGVILDESGCVYRCAPILSYMQGWSWERVPRYARSRRWTTEQTC